MKSDTSVSTVLFVSLMLIAAFIAGFLASSWSVDRADRQARNGTSPLVRPESPHRSATRDWPFVVDDRMPFDAVPKGDVHQVQFSRSNGRAAGSEKIYAPMLIDDPEMPIRRARQLLQSQGLSDTEVDEL